MEDSSIDLKGYNEWIKNGGGSPDPGHFSTRAGLSPLNFNSDMFARAAFTNLANSSKSFANRALRWWMPSQISTDSAIYVATSADIALEHLMKAVIIQFSPALVAKSDKIASVAIMVKSPKRRDMDAIAFSSIGTASAASLLEHLLPGLQIGNSVNQTMRIRNAAAHMAIVGPLEIVDALTHMIASVNSICAAIRVDSSSFWDDDVRDFAIALSVEHHRATQARFYAKLAEAKRMYSQRFGKDFVEFHARKIAELERERFHSFPPFSVYEPDRCPACGNKGQLEYEYVADPDTWDPEGETLPYQISDEIDENNQIIDRAREGFPVHFICFVCNLELVSNELKMVEWAKAKITMPGSRG